MSMLHTDFVAHSHDGKAVRQVRAFQRNAALAVTLFALLVGMCCMLIYVRGLMLDADFVHALVIITLVLAGLVVLAATVAVWSRRTMSTYLKVGSILAVDKSTRRAYVAIVKETHTNYSDDELFGRQQAMNEARDELNKTYRAKWNRTEPAAKTVKTAANDRSKA